MAINKPILIFFVVLLLTGTGCTVVHTVPLAARPGDTVMISVGSPDDMTKANTNLTYTPSGGSAIAIPNSAIRAIFNLYPDKTSAAWLYSSADLIENESGHGPWTTVLVVDLPTGGVLPQGTGTLQVNTTATYSGIVPGVNGRDIALEILPGTGSPSSFDYLGFGGVQLQGNLAELEPMKKLQFRPNFTGYDDINTYGAVEIRIGIDSSGVNDDDFNVITDDKIGSLQTRRVHSTWNKTRFELTVYFISPIGKLHYSDVNFSVISTELQRQFEAAEQNVGTDITINSVTWYDINGAVDTNGPPITIVNQTGT
ncbi:MAG: hypothetical protein ACE5FQ_04480 [Thiogranum sp.]